MCAFCLLLFYFLHSKGIGLSAKKPLQKQLSSVSCTVWVPDSNIDVLARVHVGLNSRKATGEQASI